MTKKKSNMDKWMTGISNMTLENSAPKPTMQVHKMKCGDCDVIFFVEDSKYRLSTDLSCPVCEDDSKVDGFGIVTISI